MFSRFLKRLGGRDTRKRVLVATSTGVYNHATVCDTVVAKALRLRGAHVEFLLCDGALPACQMSKASRVDAETLATVGQAPLCERCFKAGAKTLKGAHLSSRRYSEFLTADMRSLAVEIAAGVPFSDIRKFTWEGFSVGEHAYAGALRFFARGDLVGEPFGEAVLRKYLQAAILTAASVRALLQAERYDVVVAHHGIYVPQGIIVEAARQQNVRVVSWNPAYRKHSFIFSHDDTYHHTMLTEPASAWDSIELSPEIKSSLLAYLNSRRFGTGDWIWFHDQPREDIDAVLSDIGIDRTKPYVALLTSVVWDAQLHYRSNAFPDMLSWVFDSIEYFARRPELQLVIRVHPAEIRGLIPSRQKIADEIARRFSSLPANVFVVTPENQASTYALCEGANAVLIYNTKTGVEVSSLGLPVVVAGEAWIRGKGFALEATSPADYFAILERLPLAHRLDTATQDRALRYAYHFFFRRMIPLPFIREKEKLTFMADIRSDRDLAPGNYPGLDVICDGILEGKPFIYPAERLSETARFSTVSAAEASIAY
jgi:hypothetical protein